MVIQWQKCWYFFAFLQCAPAQALTPLIQLFFAMNHINYSRWLTKFQLDLLNIDGTHPGFRSILEDGVFTIRRLPKAFSRSPVDLTLEQTVNADAASRMTGMSSFTNNYSARLRWMLTKSARAAVISSVQEMAGLRGTADPTAELQGARIKRDCSDLRKVSLISRTLVILSVAQPAHRRNCLT